MAIPTVKAPAQQVYSIEPTFNSQIKRNETERMGALAGRKVTHYTITPQKTALISSLAIGVLAVALAVVLSPIALIGLVIPLGVGIYCLCRKDMDDPEVRKQEAKEMATLSPEQLVQKGKLQFLIDYDLATSESRDNRLKKYVLLEHFKDSYQNICSSKDRHAANIDAEFRAVSAAPTTQANELKRGPQNEAQRYQSRIDLLRQNLEATEELLRQKEIAFYELQTKETTFTDNTETNLHNQRRINPLDIAHKALQTFQLSTEIEKLKQTIRETNRSIDQEKAQKREKEAEIATIDKQLSVALAPLTEWKTKANMAIQKSFKEAVQKLENAFFEALDGEETTDFPMEASA